MPKARRRKSTQGATRGGRNGGTTRAHTASVVRDETPSQNGARAVAASSSGTLPVRSSRLAPVATSRSQGYQSLLFPGMVTLGCWGMAFSFTFLYTDSNHFLFGGIAALISLLWSFMFGVRLRKLLAAQRR